MSSFPPDKERFDLCGPVTAAAFAGTPFEIEERFDLCGPVTYTSYTERWMGMATVYDTLCGHQGGKPSTTGLRRCT